MTTDEANAKLPSSSKYTHKMGYIQTDPTPHLYLYLVMFKSELSQAKTKKNNQLITFP